MVRNEKSRLMARTGLFCSVSAAAFIGLGTTSALAQTAAAPTASTAPAAATDSTDSTKDPEIVVTGTRGLAGGLMKAQTAATAMQSITPAAIWSIYGVAFA